MPQIPSAILNISPENIQSLVDDSWSEDDQLEFKQDLSTKDGRPDVWRQNQKEIGERARNEILEEVVAFANAYGVT